MRDIPAQIRRGEAPAAVKQSFSPIGRWIFAHNLPEFIEALPSAPNGLYSMERHRAFALAEDLHKRAGTLTPGVSRKLARLAAGLRCVRIAHQPNFAAYLKEFSMFVSLSELANLTDTIPVYIVNDCDVARNDRFSRAMWPDVTHPLGYRYIGLPVKKLHSIEVSCASKRPERGWMLSVQSDIRKLVEREEALFARYWPSPGSINCDEIFEDLEIAWQNADSLSDFTTLFLSRVVNLRAKLDVVFLPGRLLWRTIGPRAATEILASWGQVLGAQRAVAERISPLGISGFQWRWLTDVKLSPIWWMCSCNCRVAVTFDSRFSTFDGRCNYCDKDIRFDLTDVTHYVETGSALPRIGLFDWIEGLVSDVVCGVTYMSSSIHSLIYGLVGIELGFRMLPQVFVDTTGFFGTPIELMYASRWRPRFSRNLEEARYIIAAGRASSLYYLTHTDTLRLTECLRLSILNDDFDCPVDLR